MAKANGRPPKYESHEVFVKAVEDYFKGCIKANQMPNKAGLCVVVGISRDTYNEYKKRFPDALKWTEGYIENAWVQRLAGPNATGSIFYLKNAFKEDYRDRNETDLTSNGKSLTPILVKFIHDENDRDPK